MTLDVIDRARAGQVALGTFVFEFDSNGIGRLAAGAGAEFVVFDAEHTGWGWETIGRLLATTRPAGIPAWVRVPSAEDRSAVSRALDLGARGVMAPMVESEEAARRLVAWSAYPPRGVRGAAFGIAHDDYVAGDFLDTIARANDDTVVIAQIETVAGLEEVERIAAVDGLDVLWVGHFDLTNSMGIPGRFDHPDYLAALDRVASAAADHGKLAGFMPTSVPQATDLVERGFRLLAYGGDLWIYQKALATDLGAIRSATDSGRT
ncbi:aldolase [Actinoalloteichus sp. AHMU CJ021]|uniref:2-dehydro-3-deoxyglucarate aldolase n=1 Tax=Actinoalloteichus caeruleus DSM 43889 TaxID=1120930 RepID=A0ABT1JGP4_ACTCY|nr:MULTISPECIES: aldolase/citrate lyase family protein [Actinoalloteichus]AUS77722.1 aldolase [Actinoalloteichus sp. AHMU CJ021]MCP2331647.1 2-dehydro-3-deoxyglucarate aldolase [Actinoalloteichus caeruleus DSM 43889]